MRVIASEKESAPATTLVYPLKPAAQKSQAPGYVLNVMTKWEGDALLSSIIVSGPKITPSWNDGAGRVMAPG